MKLFTRSALTALALVATAAAIYGLVQFRAARTLAAEVAATQQRHAQVSARLPELETRVAAEVRRATATEQDNTTLTAALARARTTLAPVERSQPVRPVEAVSRATVEARLARARELLRSGDPAEALRELLWCFDVGMVAQSSYAGVRMSGVVNDIKRLGDRLPEALAALRERRDRAQQRILAGGDAEIPDFVGLNRALGEEHLTLPLYDQIPATDRRRRQVMAIYAANLLLAERRYADILLGKGYSNMSSSFERDANEPPLPAATANTDRLRATQRTRTITTAAENVEILAGGGQFDHARNLAQRLLAYDTTEATRALLQQHLARAGQPDLLSTPADSTK